MTAMFGEFVDEDHSKLPTYTGYLNFIIDHISHFFNADFSSCSTTE